MNFRTNKNILLPQIPTGTGREDFDSGLIKMAEENAYNTKDDLLLIARAYKDLLTLLISKAVFIEAELTDNMKDLRNQI